jgi:hypothetical protein
MVLLFLGDSRPSGVCYGKSAKLGWPATLMELAARLNRPDGVWIHSQQPPEFAASGVLVALKRPLSPSLLFTHVIVSYMNCQPQPIRLALTTNIGPNILSDGSVSPMACRQTSWCVGASPHLLLSRSEASLGSHNQGPPLRTQEGLGRNGRPVCPDHTADAHEEAR